MNAFLQESSPHWATRNSTTPPPLLRILVVIDGRVELNREPDRFGLGYALDALTQMPSVAHVVVGIATREVSISDFSRGGHDVLYRGFKFTQDGFNLDQWDQVWIFADQPNLDDGGELDTDAQIAGPYELTDEELLRLVEWMDRGGGVFAVGDHSILGASLCYRIPRVRTMRRWTHADGVPENSGPRRNQTVQSGTGVALERDLQLQPVELAYIQTVTHLPFGVMHRPHALMCTKYGPIQHFPDHMHEGEVVPELEVQLDRTLDIAGYDKPEYPTAMPTFLPFASADAGTISWRPRPQVIAYGRTTNPLVVGGIPEPATNALYRMVSMGFKRFGLVSVYDGARANVGRVVCDSTWHHWFSYNLAGIAAVGNIDFGKMTSYYRNIALWLASPEKRAEIALSAVWTMLTALPMAFAGRRTAWEMGERATELLNEWVSPCWVNEFVAAQFDATSLYVTAKVEDSPSEGPSWGVLSEEVVHRAVLGSLCVALFPLASEAQRLQMLQNDVKVDQHDIEAAAARARAAIPRLLTECITSAADSFGALGARWVSATEKASKGSRQ
jgi:hypothetical protein